MKYFIYARKSTDEPERQILSIEAQIEELREFANKEGLEVVKTYIESQTAKKPGRMKIIYVRSGPPACRHYAPQ